MVHEFVSTPRALLFNGKVIHVVNPWHLVIDITLSNGTISVYCLSVDDVQAIKHVLLDYNCNAEINTLMLA